MKFSNLLFFTVVCSSLAGCGGGGNELGPADKIQLSQTSLNTSGPPGFCASVGPSATIQVFGGFPPYKLYNSVPDAVSLDRKVVQHSGEGFVVTFIGGCLDNMPITVTDEAGDVATLLLVNAKGS